MIELKELEISFGKNKLIENVSTIFQQGALHAIIGSNGSGKSTLLKSISGLNENYKGQIFLEREDLKTISRHKLASKIAYVNTQRPRIPSLRCEEVVSLGRTPYTSWHGNLSYKDKEIVAEAIELVGMKDYSQRYFNSLSDGESQKIMIARAIAQDTDIILLDEPTSFLDLPTRYELVNLLKKLTKEKNKTILFSTHELDIVLKFSDMIALVDQKKIINLNPDEIRHYIITSNHPFKIFF